MSKKEECQKKCDEDVGCKAYMFNPADANRKCKTFADLGGITGDGTTGVKCYVKTPVDREDPKYDQFLVPS